MVVCAVAVEAVDGAFLAVYLPWTRTWDYGDKHPQENAGYHLVFDPPGPEPYYGDRRLSRQQVDVARAAAPMLAVLVLTAGGVLLSSGKSATKIADLPAGG